MKDFFLFRKITAIGFIQILYPLGVLASIVWMIYGIYAAIQLNSMMDAMTSGMEGMDAFRPSSSGVLEIILVSILSFIILNLLWRLICEGWIVLFKMNSSLDKIEKNTQK